MAKGNHMWLTRIGELWRCNYCGATGPLDDLQGKPCPYDHPPCKYCGQTPECALDCPGITAALARPDVYVIGGVERLK